MSSAYFLKVSCERPKRPSEVFTKTIYCSARKDRILNQVELDCRYRECKLYYYLEDDSIAIVEPKQGNSGLNQVNSSNYHDNTAFYFKICLHNFVYSV